MVKNGSFQDLKNINKWPDERNLITVQTRYTRRIFFSAAPKDNRNGLMLLYFQIEKMGKKALLNLPGFQPLLY